jgi:hypothetical protein
MAAERLVLDAFLDFQWKHHLSVQVPAAYIEEMRGLTAGAHAAGMAEDCGKINQRIVVLSNFPSDTSELIIVLTNEFLHHNGIDLGSETAKMLRYGRVFFLLSFYYLFEAWVMYSRRLKISIFFSSFFFFSSAFRRSVLAKVPSLQCSMFAAWGSRTAGGTMLSARNLDWLARSGINRGKSITVFRPSDGALPSAVFGYTGLLGALAGMNGYLSVHEANLEETQDTFDGVPFVIRLREVLDQASGIQAASSVMKSTNSTVGFNHMVASAPDVTNPDVASPAHVWETMAGYEAEFGSSDPREDGATWVNPKTNATEQIGFTLKDALYRTNHGYDPLIRKDYVWDLAAGAGKSSLQCVWCFFFFFFFVFFCFFCLFLFK